MVQDTNQKHRFCISTCLFFAPLTAVTASKKSVAIYLFIYLFLAATVRVTLQQPVASFSRRIQIQQTTQPGVTWWVLLSSLPDTPTAAQQPDWVRTRPEVDSGKAFCSFIHETVLFSPSSLFFKWARKLFIRAAGLTDISIAAVSSGDIS